jgi:hypothetical protein
MFLKSVEIMLAELFSQKGKESDVKHLIFAILSREYPLRIIQLTKFIHTRYGKKVTFQAVRKAAMGLVEDGVLVKKGSEFMLSKDWVDRCRELFNELYKDLNSLKEKVPGNVEVAGDVSVFTFNSLNTMMKFWQELMEDWIINFKKGQYNVNVYQAAHVWEGLLHLDREKTLMSTLRKKGIKSYIASTGNTLFDQNIKKFYEGIGVKFSICPSQSLFDRSYYVGTYGDLIIQTHYPRDLVSDMDTFFKKNSRLQTMDLNVLLNIVNKKTEIKLTVIKNLAMAKQINKSILDRMN